jgi:hypothetical protein
MGRSTSAVEPRHAADPDPAPPPEPVGALTTTLRGQRAVIDGDVEVTVSLAVRGDIDRAALGRLHDLFEGLVGVASPIAVTLEQARCRTGRLLAELCDLRDRRARAGLCTALQGLHPGVIPDLQAAGLPEVFLAYRDAHTRRRAPEAPLASADPTPEAGRPHEPGRVGSP